MRTEPPTFEMRVFDLHGMPAFHALRAARKNRTQRLENLRSDHRMASSNLKFCLGCLGAIGLFGATYGAMVTYCISKGVYVMPMVGASGMAAILGVYVHELGGGVKNSFIQMRASARMMKLKKSQLRAALEG